MRTLHNATQTSRQGQALGDIERHLLDGGYCPDCGSIKLIRGPQGGLCINTLCEACGSEFNHGPFPQRLSDAGACDPKRQREAYGVGKIRGEAAAPPFTVRDVDGTNEQHVHPGA